MEEIRKRPMMFLGGEARSVSLLAAFLAGIDVAEGFYRVKTGPRFSGFDWKSFEKAVDQKYNPQRLSINSFGLAKRIKGDEIEAFDLWFAWYEEFDSEQKGF